MTTITKKELIELIAARTRLRRTLVRRVLQTFLDTMVDELSAGRRIEFRDFGVFEPRERRSRVAQNPRTLKPVSVPAKRTVKFKNGRMLRDALDGGGRLKPPPFQYTLVCDNGQDNGDEDRD
jgi:integration host factor subunit beta